jgi:hypothetical protein
MDKMTSEGNGKDPNCALASSPQFHVRTTLSLGLRCLQQKAGLQGQEHCQGKAQNAQELWELMQVKKMIEALGQPAIG